MHRRISIIAVMAGVVAATGGTAVAAGELITRSDQIARDVIDGGHIKSHSIARTDQQHPTLRLRVRADGGLFGDPGDGTASRIGIGNYLVRFDLTAIADPVATPKNPRWLDDCAVVATPRVGGISSVSTGQDVTVTTLRGAGPGTVIVATAKPDYELKRPVPVDAPFDLAVIC
jgi:hypothetical protein